MDGPYADFRDASGFEAAARRAAALGCEGKWTIHPNQVEAANAVFSPTEEEIRQARRILDALAQSEKSGQSAVSLDGRMIDVASIRQAKGIMKKAETIQ